jgi:hypothetical protein
MRIPLLLRHEKSAFNPTLSRIFSSKDRGKGWGAHTVLVDPPLNSVEVSHPCAKKKAQGWGTGASVFIGRINSCRINRAAAGFLSQQKSPTKKAGRFAGLLCG